MASNYPRGPAGPGFGTLPGQQNSPPQIQTLPQQQLPSPQPPKPQASSPFALSSDMTHSSFQRPEQSPGHSGTSVNVQNQLLSPLATTSSTLPINVPSVSPKQSPGNSVSYTNGSNQAINSPDSTGGSTSFASPNNSNWWYPVDLDNSQYGIQSEDALIQQTFQSPEEFHEGPRVTQWPQQQQQQMQLQHQQPQMQLQQPQLLKPTGLPYQDGPSPSGPSPIDMQSPPGTNTYPYLAQPRPQQQPPKPTQAPSPLSQQYPIRKHTPSVSEAAAMAAEIIAHESANASSLSASASTSAISSSSSSTPSTNAHSKKPRPCDSCRKRKVRCIMLPSEPARCLHCEFRKQQCTFLEAPLRKSRPKKNEKQTEQLVQQQQQVLGEMLMQRPKLQYKDYASLGGHALLKKALSLQYPRSAYLLGPTSVYDPLLVDPAKPSITPTDVELRSVSPTITFALHNDYSEELYARSIQNCDAVEAIVAPHGQHLIDLYFKIVHPAFPILHKQVFLEKYKRTHREFLAPLLAAVYLMALNWWHLSPPSPPCKKPNAEALFKLATTTFADALDRPKLASIQAGLLLLQCRPSRGGNWMLCSQVVAIAEELALGYDCSKWKIPRWERGLRRRLAWAVWLQDQWLALAESRPAHTDRLRTWLISEPVVEDFPERAEVETDHGLVSEVENGRLVFMEMIKLSAIMEDIRNQLFSIMALRQITQTEDILERAKPLQLRLRNWYHSLPQSLLLKSDHDTKRLPANGYLHLSYFATELTLHRRIIRSLPVPGETSTVPRPPNSPPIEVLVGLCRDAAKTRLLAAIKFVTQLRPEHLHAFWYSSSRFQLALISSFAGLLFVTSSTGPDSDEAALYRDQLTAYKQVLCQHATQTGFEPAAGALTMMREVLGRVPALCADDAAIEHELETWRKARRQEEEEQNELEEKTLKREHPEDVVQAPQKQPEPSPKRIRA